MNILIKEIDDLNKYNWEYLNFGEVVKNNFPELVEKILKIHLEKRFNFNNLDKNYYLDISNFIIKNIFNKEKLVISDYEKLYIKIFQLFFKKNYDSEIKYDIISLDLMIIEKKMIFMQIIKK
ncbi:MAG: hypothetical protein Q9M97_08920 [Candidatus Gracilibacteria bacterium]|nr:hypothetical protein [Candidatus Gracilibacteria bacterium]